VAASTSLGSRPRQRTAQRIFTDNLAYPEDLRTHTIAAQRANMRVAMVTCDRPGSTTTNCQGPPAYPMRRRSRSSRGNCLPTTRTPRSRQETRQKRPVAHSESRWLHNPSEYEAPPATANTRRCSSGPSETNPCSGLLSSISRFRCLVQLEREFSNKFGPALWRSVQAVE
jgi:hypothetical protein